jgi:hypothetical protein
MRALGTSRRRIAAVTAMASLAAGIGAGGAVATPSVYRTTITAETHGGDVVGGTVTTAANGKLEGVNLRKRCRAGRLVDLSPPHGADRVKVRTDSKGRWSVTLPEIRPGTYKAFVTARSLPADRSCAGALAKFDVVVQIP